MPLRLAILLVDRDQKMKRNFVTIELRSIESLLRCLQDYSCMIINQCTDRGLLNRGLLRYSRILSSTSAIELAVI